MDQYLIYFALCTIKNKYVLLTAGHGSRGLSAKSFLLDCETGKWVADQELPDLRAPRRRHASVATDNAAFVFGGFDKRDILINSVEMLSLENFDKQKKFNGMKWIAFNIPGLTTRAYPLMAALNNKEILVLGGSKGGWLSDGMVFDAENMTVKRQVSARVGVSFKGNQHIVTQDGTVLAIAEKRTKNVELIEVATDGPDRWEKVRKLKILSAFALLILAVGFFAKADFMTLSVLIFVSAIMISQNFLWEQIPPAKRYLYSSINSLSNFGHRKLQ